MASDNTINQQFIVNDDTFNDDSKHIYTDLYTAILYVNQFKKTQMNGGYIQIPYFMPSGTMRPNATYISNVETKKYKCKNLYIFKASHNILMDSTFDAELVIELIPSTNTSEKLYLCFLLKNTRYVDAEKNDIDKLINISIKPPHHYSPIEFHLGKLVEKKQKKIVYKSGIDNVIIFIQPIAISETDFTGYATISSSLFAIYPVYNYNIIKPSDKEGFYGKIIEGFDLNNLLKSPDDVEKAKQKADKAKKDLEEANKKLDQANQIKDTVNNNEYVAGAVKKDKSTKSIDNSKNAIPSDIENAFNNNLVSCTPVDENDNSLVKDEVATYLMDSSQNKNIAQMAITYAFLITILCIIISSIGGPIFFHHTIYKYIKDGQTLTIVSSFVSAIFFILAMVLLLDGLSNDSNAMWTGAFLLILLCLSMLAIAYDRAKAIGLAFNFESINGYAGIKKVLDSFLSRLPDKGLWAIIGFIMIILTIILVPIGEVGTVNKSSGKFVKLPKHTKSLLYGIGFTYGFVLAMWIAIIARLDVSIK